MKHAPETMGQMPNAGNYSAAKYEVTEHFGVMIPMRDGLRLSVDIYAPKSSEKLPVILTITPYGSKSENLCSDAQWYAARGYAYIIANSRGRYDSDGDWDPFDSKHKSDGYDLVEWIAAQSWSNGKVGMIGLSYMGQTQWWTASMAPPHLTTIVPSAAQPDRFAHAPYNNGVLAGWYIEWCAMMTGRTNQENSSKARGGLIEVLKHTPYADLDAFMGMENAPWFKEIYHQNKSGDPYWTNISYQTPESYSRMTTPSLAFTGWFDTSHAGTSMNYFGMKRFGATPQARRPHIVIGPWIHIINTPVGDGIDYGPDATIDLNGYTARWFDHFLKGIDNGVEKDPPVYVFVMGENKWHAEQDWPLPEAKPTKYYLISNRHANSLTGIGGLTTIPPDTAGSNSYVYDPRNPTLDTSDSAGLANQGARDTRLSALGDEILVFQTPPLRSPVEVTGPIEATLYAATSARDTDWMVRLVDVYPDGRSLFLAEGVMRARNRDPANEGRFNAAQLTTIESGKVYQYTIRFWRDTANLFQRGHRIGVEISSSWYPYYIPNLNTGADNLAMVSLSEAVVAHQTVCHGGAYPSHILLPVIPKR